MIKGVTDTPHNIVLTRNGADVRSRSEYTLLYELIQRNPDRAVEFLRRLGYAVKCTAGNTQAADAA